ncbi:hypothetical protein EVAR_80510_1 [Eumeta japonica]|uniref:Uncharacterized protein n=1 Tax=Eumeta variegata TaxID=151549 RepID=A0A4C1TNC6_EUMVA|nr:hypothetical protein EVAR_80510_1 [Eumeta japonica]
MSSTQIKIENEARIENRLELESIQIETEYRIKSGTVIEVEKEMVATEESGGAVGQVESAGTFGKLRQTLSSSLLTAQDKGMRRQKRKRQLGVFTIAPLIVRQRPKAAGTYARRLPTRRRAGRPAAT